MGDAAGPHHYQDHEIMSKDNQNEQLVTDHPPTAVHHHNYSLIRRYQAKNCKVMICRVYGFLVRVWKYLQMCRALIWKCYKTHISSGNCGNGVYTDFTEIPGGYKYVVPVPRVLWHGHTELTQVPGTGMNVIQNSQKFRVRV